MASAAGSSSSAANDVAAITARLQKAPHIHSRGKHPAYPARQTVTDEQQPWSAPFPAYRPPEFTADNVQKKSPDNEDARAIPELSKRASYEVSALELGADGRPLNPRGRTGLAGRGKLYKWGPNQAADPLVTRCSSAHKGELEVLLIQRGDTGAWALPGGMVDDGEQPLQTARREFGEEALAHEQEDKKKQAHALLPEIFDEARVERVYRGEIDDPRNTDNAWMESCVFHAHLDEALAARLSPLLKAGDDAKEVRWLLASPDEPAMEKLYASHKDIVQLAVAQWKSKQ